MALNMPTKKLAMIEKMIPIDSHCKRAKDLMSGAVDAELSAEEFAYFDQHIESCETCRNEFELEKLTQAYFKGKVGMLDPPEDLLESIRFRLSYEDATRMRQEPFPQLSYRRYFWPALGIAIVLIFIITVFVTKSHRTISEFPEKSLVTTDSQTQDALEASEYDFQNLLKGNFHPQFETQTSEAVIGFIKQKAGYSIPLPVVHNADWIGGSVTTLEKEKVVNVAYKMGKFYIYIYAFPTTLAHSKAVSLSLECIGTLDKNEWFWSHSSEGNLQVAWKFKNHVCVATSNLGKNDLVAYLKTSNGIDDKGWQ